MSYSLPGRASTGSATTANPLLPTPTITSRCHSAIAARRVRGQIPVFAAGEHRVKVKDPITSETVEVNFQVTSLSAERRSAVRNAAIQERAGGGHGGKSYDLLTASHLPDEIRTVVRTESTIEVFPLWNTWPCFGAGNCADAGRMAVA